MRHHGFSFYDIPPFGCKIPEPNKWPKLVYVAKSLENPPDANMGVRPQQRWRHHAGFDIHHLPKDALRRLPCVLMGLLMGSHGGSWSMVVSKKDSSRFSCTKSCFTPFSEEFYGRSSNEIVKEKKCGWKGIFLHHYPIPVGAIGQQIRFFPSIFKSFRYQQRRCRNPYKAILGVTFPLT